MLRNIGALERPPCALATRHSSAFYTNNKLKKAYLQVGSGLPGGGRPHEILRSRQKVQARLGFLNSFRVFFPLEALDRFAASLGESDRVTSAPFPLDAG